MKINKRKLSLIYLIWGTLAAIGFIAFFELRSSGLQLLVALALPFYLAALTFTILIHPLLCSIELIKRKKGEKKNIVVIHLIWSLVISSIFIGMITNGYIITA